MPPVEKQIKLAATALRTILLSQYCASELTLRDAYGYSRLHAHSVDSLWVTSKTNAIYKPAWGCTTSV